MSHPEDRVVAGSHVRPEFRTPAGAGESGWVVPYTDPDRQRAFARNWVAARRAAFMAGRRCEVCGSTTNLRPYHPSVPMKGIWTRRAAYREPLLAEATVMCQRCAVGSRLGQVEELVWCEAEKRWMDACEHRLSA